MKNSGRLAECGGCEKCGGHPFDGTKAKFLNDNDVYFGNQIEKDGLV